MAEPYPIPRMPYPVGDLDHGQLFQVNQSLPTRARTFEWIGYELRTVSSTTVPLTTNTTYLTNATFAFISVETNPINYTLFSGTVPTTSVGHPAPAGSVIELQTTRELQDFKMIRSGGADSTVKVSYGRYNED